MSSEIVGLIGIVILIVLLFSRMWLGLAMALVGIFGYAYLQGFDRAFVQAGTVPFNTIANYALSTIPLFMLMGIFIRMAGLGEELYNSAHKWLGQLRGGLSIATVLASTIFGAITGVSMVSLFLMGKVALPEMRKHGYSDTLSTGCIVCAGSMAVLIPPSLAFILYALLTGESVGKLFMAGILPGLLLAALYILTIMVITKIQPGAAPPGPKTNFKEKILSLKYIWHVALLVVLMLGGIYGGVFTPTEAGAIGAFGALVITFSMGRIKLKDGREAFLEAGVITGQVVLLMSGAYLFAKFIAVTRIADMLSGFLTELALPTAVFFALLILMYIILGMFLDIVSAIIVTMPIFFPIVTALGYDPIWYGVIVVLVMQMGMITPPIGLEVFVLSAVTGVPANTIFRGALPFILAIVLCIVILILFPQIALFLPSGMVG